MKFENYKLKLVVIDKLMSFGHFKREVKSLVDEHWDGSNFNYEPIAEIENYFKQLDLTDEQFADIKSIEFDGGLEIYHQIIPNWDGEDDYFDVDSLDGIEKLSNLEEISVISILTTADIEPLLKLNSLKKVRWYEIFYDGKKAFGLREKGIIVES